MQTGRPFPAQCTSNFYTSCLVLRCIPLLWCDCGGSVAMAGRCLKGAVLPLMGRDMGGGSEVVWAMSGVRVKRCTAQQQQ